MADRFPSLDDFDAGETEARDTSAAPSSFLERERAALGDEFGGTTDRQATIEDGDDDLLGGDYSAPVQTTSQPSGGIDEFDDFESSFPAVDTRNSAVGPNGSITNVQPNMSYTSGYATQSSTEDSEPIRAWREKRDADIARRDAASAAKKEQTIKTAREDIDSFYETYNRKADKGREQVKKEAEEFMAKRENTTAGGTTWERIAKLSDVHTKKVGGENAGKSKMRELLVDLSKDKNAPGSTVSV